MHTGVATVENSMEFPQKIKNGTASWPSNSTSWNTPQETPDIDLKEYRHLYAHCNIICNSQYLEAAQVPTSRWVDKIAVVHVHNEVLLSHKKEGNLTFHDSTDGPRGYYSKWNKPIRERQIPNDFTYMYTLMNKINK